MKIKVLFDLHPYTTKTTGIGRYSFNLINQLKKTPQLQLTAFTTPKTNPLKKIAKFQFPFTNGISRIFLGLPLAIQQLKPHIVHFHYFPPLIHPKNTILVNTIHDLCFLSHAQHFSFKKRLMFQTFCLPLIHKSDAIIVPSNFVRHQLLRFTKVKPNKIHIIPEGVDPIFHPINKTLAKTKVLHNFHISSPFFLVVGNIEPRKHPETIIKSFIPIINHPQKPHLVFVGPPNQYFKQLLMKYSNQQIHHLSYVENKNLNLLYNAATGLIYYSDCEGFGLPPLEAARTHTPVILKDNQISHETMANHALFVSSPQQLTSTLNLILNTKPNSIIKAAYHHSLNFTWEKTAETTQMLYQTLIQSQKSKSN